MLKKRVVPLLLAVALLWTSYGCRSRKSEPDMDTAQPPSQTTAPDETHISIPLPPTPPPDPTTVGSAVQSLLLEEETVLEGEDITPELERSGYTLSIPMESTPSFITVNGWVGFKEAIDSFGYRMNGGETVYGLFETHTEEAIRESGGAYARRYSITVPIFNLKTGAHTVELLVRLADGSVHAVLPALTVVKEGLTTDLNRTYHSSVTHLNQTGPYEGRGGSIDRGVDVIDATLNGIAVETDCKLRLNGWLALEGGVERYVWSPDGHIWYTALSGSSNGEPSEGHFASLGYENASENALFQELTLNLSPCGGRVAWITVGAVPKDAPDCVVPFITVTGLNVPIAPTDIEYYFYSDIDSNPLGTDLLSSDLNSFFDISYGAGDTRRVDLVDNVPLYLYEGIHSLQAMMDGTYAISATLSSMGGGSFLFVRGTKQVVSVDSVPIPLTNFFETDGLQFCGGAGIYARLCDGSLMLVVKGLDPGVAYRIRNYVYEIPAEGKTLTLTDDGSTVSCYVDGKLMASVRCEGFTEYPDHFASVQPYVYFARTATVTLADGRTDVIQDTLIASTCASQAGIAIRGGHIYFSNLNVIPLSDYLADPH